MDELIRQAEEQRRKTQLSQQENDRMEQMADSQRSVGLAVIEGAKAQINAHDAISQRPQKTEITNPSTPISMAVTNLNVTAFKGKDADKIAKKLDVQIDAIHKLGRTLAGQQMPEAVHELSVSNLTDLIPTLEEVRDSIRSLKLKSPDVHVPAPVVSVAAPDMSVLSDYLDNIQLSLAGLSKVKMPQFDSSPIVEAFEDFKRFIGGLSMPSSGGSSGGNTAKGFIDVPFDEVDITSYTANNDPAIVIYKRAGQTVATLTITYDGTNRITKVVKS